MAETATMVGVGAESGVDRGGDGGGGAGGGGGGGGGALVPLPNAAWKGSSKGFGIAAGGFPDKVFVFYFTVYSRYTVLYTRLYTVPYTVLYQVLHAVLYTACILVSHVQLVFEIQ